MELTSGDAKNPPSSAGQAPATVTLATPWRDRADRIAEWADAHLVVRRDCYVTSYLTTERRVGRSYVKLRRPTLGTGHFLRHFQADGPGQSLSLAAAVRVTDPDSGLLVTSALWTVVETDHHGDEPPPEAHERAMIAWHDRTAARGLRPILEDSNGHGGFHLWILYDEPILAHRAKAFGRWLTRDWKELGLKSPPEVFPAQDRLSDRHPYGSTIRVPGRHPIRPHWSRIWDGSAWLEGDAAIDELLDHTGDSPRLLPVEILMAGLPARPEKPADGGPTDLERIKSALAAIGPGVKDEEGREFLRDRGAWIGIGMAAHHGSGGSDEGREAWDAWSKQVPDAYEEGACEVAWESFSDDGGVTVATLFHHATKAGWKAHPPTPIESLGEPSSSLLKALPPPAKAPPAPSTNGDGEPAAGGATPPPFRLEVITSRELAKPLDPPGWCVKGVLVRDDPCIVGGPMKTLKTSVLTDLTISLGTATRFLGHYVVPEPMRVGFLSGETGCLIVRANAQQICWDRELELDALENVVWGFTLPQLLRDDHLREVARIIADHALQALTLDPFYLTLDGTVDVKSMFSLGPILDRFGKVCLDAGCMPILAHHFVKSRDDPYAPPELHELAYGGVPQWMRQWILLARREPYDPATGLHRLHLRYGGGFGHAGEVALDVNTGVLDEDFRGRRWGVTVQSVGDRIAQEEQAKEAQATVRREKAADAKEAAMQEQTGRDVVVVLDLLRGATDPLTHTALRNLMGWGEPRRARAFAWAEREGLVRQVTFVKATTTGRKHSCIGWESVLR